MITLSRLKKNFGLKVKKCREDSGLTQTKLAELIGIEPASLSRIESGKSFVSSVILHKICRALNVEPVKLFDFKDIYENDLPKNDKIIAINTILAKLTDEQLDFIHGVITTLKQNI